MKAQDLKPGMQYKSGRSIQEVTRIERITDKAITYRTKRISPNPYDGDLFQRKQLNTEVEIVN